MAKLIKYQDNVYLDSTGILHNKNKLSTILTPIILFEGNRVTTNITLNDDINNYSYLEFYYTCNGVKCSCRALAQNSTVALITEGERSVSNFMILCTALITINNNQITFYKNISIGGYEGTTPRIETMGSDGWYRVGIDKVIGYK